MKIAGRDEEIRIMQGLLDNESSEFLAIYGRRRIGKTYLIRQLYQESIVFECSGLHEKVIEQQLENFWISLTENDILENPALPKTWLQAFESLKSYLKNIKSKKKKVIFLDEIAWFETAKSGFLAALGNFWNNFCSKRNDIVLVICGSAASWIIDKVINNKGGLHNRVTCHIQLMPFTLGETKEFLQMANVKLTQKDIASIYMAVGGVPYYLKDIKAGFSVPQILDQLFFAPQATLKNEFLNLYASLFKNSNLHIAIVKALASTNKGLTRSEILAKTGIASGGAFSILLNELVQCGFIKIILPIHKTKEDFLYRLVDEYSIFYYNFLINSKKNNSWMQQSSTQAYKIWTGYAFENLCFKHVAQIKKALGISGIISNEYSWVCKGNKTEKGCQIDFIIDRNDNCINILELKYHDAVSVISKDYAAQLHEKRVLFIEKNKLNKNVFITILAANGVQKNEYYLSAITNEIQLTDLFKKL